MKTVHLEELINSVNLYKDSRKSFDKKELQDVRERISLSLFYLSDLYSEVRSESEAAEFRRKLCYAQEEERLRNFSEKKMTREQIMNETRIKCVDADEELISANKDYYKIRMIVETAHQILHSIASRLNQLSTVN